MDKVMLIGRFNSLVSDVNSKLSNYYSVQLCSDDPIMVEGMLKMVHPDLIVVSLVTGGGLFDPVVFKLIMKYCRDVPVLTIGTDEERKGFQSIYEREQFEHIQRPVTNQKIYEACAKKLESIKKNSDEKLKGSREEEPSFDEISEEAQEESGQSPAATAPVSSREPESLEAKRRFRTPEEDEPGLGAPGSNEVSANAPAAMELSDELLGKFFNVTPAKKKILVVDDDPMMLRNVKKMLDENYDVSIVNSGMKAITSLGKKKPDLILLDYEMPICDGKQTLEMIRSDEAFKDIPVVFLTGLGDMEHIKAVLSLRPAGYMLKPPDKDKLIASITKVLGR